MMGFQGTPARLFYDFCLEEHVPVDNMLRGIDRHLALDDLRRRCHTNVDRRGAGFRKRADLRPRWRLATFGTLRL